MIFLTQLVFFKLAYNKWEAQLLITTCIKGFREVRVSILTIRYLFYLTCFSMWWYKP